MFSLSQPSSTWTPVLWWKLMTLLTWGSGAGWASHWGRMGQSPIVTPQNTQSDRSKQGVVNFQARICKQVKAPWAGTARTANFWGVLKDRRSKGSHGDDCLPRIISLAGTQNLRALSSVHFEAACLIPIISRQCHVSYISEIPGVKMQCMHYTKIRVKRIFIQIEFNDFVY